MSNKPRNSIKHTAKAEINFRIPTLYKYFLNDMKWNVPYCTYSLNCKTEVSDLNHKKGIAAKNPTEGPVERLQEAVWRRDKPIYGRDKATYTRP